MWPLIASIAAPAIGGIIGNASAAADAEDSRKMRQKAIDQWSNISTPSVSDQSVSLQRFKNAGDLRPELEQTFQQGQTEMRSLNSDPILRQAQYQALGRLQDISNQGGMSAQDRDRQAQIQIENSRQEKAQRGAISQNMAARGLSGSGVDIAAHLQAQQSAANRNSEQSRSIQAMAQQRALQAMMSSGELAGHMQSQQYQQQADTRFEHRRENDQQIQLRHGAPNFNEALHGQVGFACEKTLDRAGHHAQEGAGDGQCQRKQHRHTKTVQQAGQQVSASVVSS